MRTTAKPSVPPSAPIGVGGFGGAGSINLDGLNAIIDELYRAGTIPNALSASDTAPLIDLPTLAQLCTNVPTAPDATIGGLEIMTPPFLSASSVSTENLNVVFEIKLPILGSQPSFFQAKLSIEIVVAGLRIFPFVPPNVMPKPPPVLRFSIVSTGAEATLVVNPLSEIVPNTPADLDTLNTNFTTALINAIDLYCGPGDASISLSAEHTFSALPNTDFKLTRAGAATVQNGQTPFAVLGVNIGSDRTVDPTQLATVAAPVAPFNVHAEIDQSLATDLLTAVISSGDLATYINRISARHWWGDLLPAVTVNSGDVTFQDGNVNLTIGITVPYYCLGLDFDILAGISGPLVISNGAMTIGASSVDLSVDEGFWCALTGIFVPLAMVLEIIFIAGSAFDDVPAQTIPSSFTSPPPTGTDQDWTLTIQQASANNGTLILDGTGTLTADPGYFIYLRFVTGNHVTGYTPLPKAMVTLMELDNPAPTGDDVGVPQTGVTIHNNSTLIIIDSTSYTPTPDQVLGTNATDVNGDVMFTVEPATASNPGGLNEEGGVLSATQTEINVKTGTSTLDYSTTTIVPEKFPDFGVAVTDSAGTVLTTRQLVVLNAASTHIGTAQNPVVVVVSDVVHL
jgi:hypothetical protein